jgi:hypothetical protein
LADGEAFSALTEPLHHPDHFVSRDHRRPGTRQVPVDDVQVRATYSAGCDSDQELVGSRLWDRKIREF